jgi:RND superfamily putative drug exporter
MSMQPISTRPELMERLTVFCLRHKRWVLAFWLLMTIAGAAAAGGLQSRLDQTFSLPGQQGYQVNQKILRAYGGGGSSFPNVVAIRVPAGQRADSPAVQATLTTAFGEISQLGAKATRLAKAPPPAAFHVAYPGTPGAPGSVTDPKLLSADGRTAFGVVYLPTQGFSNVDTAPATRAILAKAGFPVGTQTGVTGLVPLSTDSGGGSSSGSGVLVETLLASIGALIVLAFVFRSFIAVIPLVTAVVAILSTFLVISGLAELVSVSFIVQFLVGLVGLGVAIDYSLLTVTRWREERDQGSDNEQAVITAMRTAGHAVVFSGITVAVGLFALVFLPVPFLRSIGYGGMLIPLTSIAVASTLLPIVLATVGPRLDRHRLGRTTSGQASKAWTSWARLIIKRRWIAAIVAFVILGGLGLAATQIAVGEPKSSALSQGGPGLDGLDLLTSAGIGSGVITPIEVFAGSADTQAIIRAAAAVSGIRTAFLSGDRPGQQVVEVIPNAETSQAPGSDVITPVKRAVQPLGGAVGGTGVEAQDFNKAVYGSFPLMLSVIVVVTYLLLARAFRSVLLPLKAVLLNLISVGATYGVLVLVWQKGHGSKQIWDVAATGSITNWVPLMVFAFLFGLSMDYEVFILARMREEYDRTGSTSAAVVEGIGRTGRLVTSAALILFLAFVALSQSPGTDIKIFATGLGAGILLDATVVRSLLVPALVSLFGRYNWGLGGRFARVLRVPASPLKAEARSL